jgi:hypothetical protein
MFKRQRRFGRSKRTKRKNVTNDFLRQLYLDTRKSYLATQCEQSNLRDKYILTLSAAALALSITYIEKIAPLGEAIWVPLLIFSWVLFALPLLFTVFSFHYTVDSYNDFLNQLDGKFDAGEELEGLSSPLTKRVDTLNRLSVCIFAAGILAFSLFAAVNILQRSPAQPFLNQEGTMSEKKPTQPTRPPQSPPKPSPGRDGGLGRDSGIEKKGGVNEGMPPRNPPSSGPKK